MSSQSKSLWRFVPVNLAVIFFSLHYALTLYINSTYLENFFSPTEVSLLFILGAVGSIWFFFHTPRIIRVLGHRSFLVLVLSLELLCTLGLATTSTHSQVATLFIIYGSITALIPYLLDLYLEHLSTNKRTGEIRGIYLTLSNLAIASAPFLLTYLAVGEDLGNVYVVAALLLLPLIVIALTTLDPKLPQDGLPQKILLPIRAWWQRASVRRVALARFVLEFFFAIMIIFAPLYLHGVLGFSWQEIGVMFAIMLLPFVFLTWPAGEVADRWLGEKELMTLGFFISGVSLLFMPFLDKNFFHWTLVLFISRIGASLVEVTTESYFFKQIDVSDSGLTSIFRLARPTAIIAGTCLGAIAVAFLSFKILFFFLAIIILLGMYESVTLKDTK